MLKFSRLVVLILSILMITSCGSKEEGPIYDPSAEDSGSERNGDGLYNINSKDAPDGAKDDGEYVSPYASNKEKRIQWYPSIKAAQAVAKPGSGLKVLLWFTNSKCAECRKIENGTFATDVVLDQAIKYVWVRYDTDANPEKKKYYIQDHDPPALKWLDHDANSYHSLYTDFDNPELVALHLQDFH